MSLRIPPTAGSVFAIIHHAFSFTLPPFLISQNRYNGANTRDKYPEMSDHTNPIHFSSPLFGIKPNFVCIRLYNHHRSNHSAALPARVT
jgi:hypothetical protein